MSTKKPKPVLIKARIKKDKDGYPKSQDWEELWGEPVEEGYVIRSIPFFAKGIALGDLVKAARTEEGMFRVVKVIRPSGHSVFRLWLAENRLKERSKVRRKLASLDCQSEVTLNRMIAIDVPPEREAEVWNYVKDGHTRGDWGLQVGCSR